MSTYEWANTYRFIAKSAAANSGKFNGELTPYMEGIYDLFDDPNYPLVVCKKSSQVAWTEAVNNKIGKHAHISPLGIVAMFSSDTAARVFEREKLINLIEATPVLASKISTNRSKASGNTWNFKKFKDGFIKLVGSNSPSSVKGTAAPLTFVEEPDDANRNVKGQGNTIKLLRDRSDTFDDAKMIFGGTPTITDLSQVDAGYELSDQRVYMVPCHHCGDEHELDFDNLFCREYNDDYVHEVYGKLNPETAYYACPHCGGEWDDFNKNLNVRAAKKNHIKGWKITQRSTVAGVRLNALLSPFPGASFAKLKALELEAKKSLDEGDDSDWIAFVNTRKGQSYKYGNSDIDVNALIAKAADYLLGTVPAGGLLLTAGVDIQHDRIHIIIRAWGRNEQSWLVDRIVIYGTTSQKSDPVWKELESMLWRPYKHESGALLTVSAISLDTSDGVTSDAAYSWVAKYQKNGVMGIKGSNNYDAPLYRVPSKKRQANKAESKAERYGVNVYSVGTTAAKDLIIGTSDKTGRVRLTQGSGAMFWPTDVDEDYYSQVLGEIKAPHRTLKKRLVWQQKAGQAVEDLDCEVYALHASRRMRVHLLNEPQWSEYEQRVLQVPLFDSSEQQVPQKTKKRPQKRVFGGV